MALCKIKRIFSPFAFIFVPMTSVNAKQLVAYLQTLVPPGMKGLDKVKVVYRPYICPLHELLNRVPEQAAVFDIGCGNGSFLALAAHFRNPARLGGIEINDRLVQNASDVLKNTVTNTEVSIQWYDGLNIPDFIGSYSHVFMTDVFHHIPPAIQKDVMQQVFDKMSSGSVFIMKDIDAGKLPWVYFNKLHDRVAAGEIGNEISSQSMETLLKEVGFGITEYSYKQMLWYPHYTFVCKKV
jgi:2-polyprenyl-3-methyl-5-hydroxy-6-metoxy-1,4-benzoquinol methylase